jgi:hypothetical protein
MLRSAQKLGRVIEMASLGIRQQSGGREPPKTITERTVSLGNLPFEQEKASQKIDIIDSAG